MNAPRPGETPPEWIDVVRAKVEGLRYGIVQIVVHDGKVTQIDRTERTRLDAPIGGGLAARKPG